MRISKLLLVFATAGLLLAQQAPRVRAGQQGAGAGQARPAIAALKAALGLTDQQVEQLGQLRREMAEALRPLRDEMQQKAQALREAVGAANADSALVGKLTLEARNLRQQVQQLQATYRERSMALLTAEQKEKLQNIQQSAGLGPALAGARGLGLIGPPAPGQGAGTGQRNAQPGARMRLRARQGRL
jgi:Spy/CpxP family protein refolding chaperone